MSSINEPPDSMPDSMGRKAEDEDGQSETSTIQRIQKFRDHLADYQVWFAQNEVSSEVSERAQIRSYHKMAQGLVQILSQYLTDPNVGGAAGHTDGAQAHPYWGQHQIAEFTIDPPEAVGMPSQMETEHAIRAGNTTTLGRFDRRASAEPKTVSIYGLREYAQLDAEWSVSWTMMFGPEVSIASLRREIDDSDITVEDRTHPNQPITIHKRGLIPKAVIDNAVRAMERFVRDIGLDVEFTGEDYMGEGGPGV